MWQSVTDAIQALRTECDTRLRLERARIVDDRRGWQAGPQGIPQNEPVPPAGGGVRAPVSGPVSDKPVRPGGLFAKALSGLRSWWRR